MLLTRSNLSSKVFGIVCIAFLVSSGISLGFGIISFGLIITVLLCLFLKNIENFFLFWLLLSPLLTIDALAFYIIYGHPILTFDRVVIGTLFLLLLIEVSIGKRKLLPMNNLEIAMILFSVVIIYSIISYSANKLTGARMFVDSFLYPFIIYFLTKNLISDVKYFNKFINVLIIIGTYLSLMGIYEYLTGIDIFPTATGLVKREGWLRVNGPYKLDSTFGVNVTICFFITLYKYIGYNKNNGMNMRKVSFILILSFLLLAIFFNFYRGIWIAFILGSLFWIFMKMKSIKLMFYILILAMIVILSYDRLESTDLFQGRISNVKSLHSRLHAFDNAINLIKTNCIIYRLFLLSRYPVYTHIRLEYIRNVHGAVIILIVLQNRDDCAGYCACRRVEGMHDFSSVTRVLPGAYLEPSCLVVSTIGA